MLWKRSFCSKVLKVFEILSETVDLTRNGFHYGLIFGNFEFRMPPASLLIQNPGKNLRWSALQK